MVLGALPLAGDPRHAAAGAARRGSPVHPRGQLHADLHDQPEGEMRDDDGGQTEVSKSVTLP